MCSTAPAQEGSPGETDEAEPQSDRGTADGEMDEAEPARGDPPQTRGHGDDRGWHTSRTEDWRKEPKHMHIIWILLIGLIVGALAKLVMPGRDPGGAIVTILIGIAGSFIANYIGRAAGWYAPNESAGLIASILGAVILLAGYRLVTRRRVVGG